MNSEAGDQDGDVGGFWSSLLPQMQWMYSYRQSNFIWEKSRDQLNVRWDSHMWGEWENTHSKMDRKVWASPSVQHHTTGRESSPGLPWWTQMVKKPVCNTGDLGSIPRLGRIPEEGNGNPLEYSCLENSMGRGTWLATVPGVGKICPGLSD